MKGLSGKGEDVWLLPFWKAGSVSEFWRLWNPPFHAKLFAAFRFVRRRVRFRGGLGLSVLSAFALSGFLHDLLLLTPFLGMQFGLTIWFFLNGVIVVCEHYFPPRLGPAFGRVYTMACLLGTLAITSIVARAFNP